MHVLRGVGSTAVEEARICGVSRRGDPRVFGNLVWGVARGELERKGGVMGAGTMSRRAARRGTRTASRVEIAVSDTAVLVLYLRAWTHS